MSEQYRDLVTSHLREDTRIRASVLAMRRIYRDPLYEIYICIYSGLLDSIRLSDELITCLVVFKAEKLRLMFKMGTARIEGDRNQFIEEWTKKLADEGKTPYHLIHDAKTWCQVPFTADDLLAFQKSQISL